MKNILILAGDNDGGAWCWHLDDISQLDNYPKVKQIIENEVNKPNTWGINEDYECPVSDALNEAAGFMKDKKFPFVTEHLIYYYCRR
ncbi:MAG: hypothetical protein SLAVMIC_00493 [uncultured marine phage]|uniref:Uncharacterized protein n=1 Tax=uncultured marine phage TaxID=707152 RepID=A0A8D9FR46_9VIRU|nr:MAG: hypothetical protein SLAVMIC_00493 [uncultured marine phage]